jgi:diguanylate cyclase (GGDEF)-like protein
MTVDLNTPQTTNTSEIGSTAAHAGNIQHMLDTMLSTLSDIAIVAVIPVDGAAITEDGIEPIVRDGAEAALATAALRIGTMMNGHEPLGDFSFADGGTTWSALVQPILSESTFVVGALVLAMPDHEWTARERNLAGAFGELLSVVATRTDRDRTMQQQQRLDELVACVAERLMPATSKERHEVFTWTTRMLAEFLGSDVAFVRRNDHERGLSVLEAEWPPRDWSGDGPDPLGEVSFDADPIFAATKDLRHPYFPGPEDDDSADYLLRIEKSSGVPKVAGVAVPLLVQDFTWGCLGFIHFGLHAWAVAEINALQSVASMLVQLQGRFDAEHSAHHDELTGLPNRRALIQELDERMATHDEIGVMIIDLDRFKVMNDFLGHASGDLLLTTIADRIRTSIRPGDFAARLGGDEFVFLMADAATELEALAGARRILELIAKPVQIGGQLVNHTASIGVTLATPGVTGLDLVGFADIAMYAAKAKGGNQAVVFGEELRAVTNERSRTELLLSKVLERDELVLHYQPEVDLDSGELLAVEALVRWQHPARGLLAAGEFISIAEDAGLMPGIDRWVLREACRQLSRWQAAWPSRDFAVRVNMSPADFKHDDIVEFVEDCLTSYDVSPGRLCIEVTEHVVVTESERTADILQSFRDLGVQIAIDDFGTGFASMTELKHLPVDFLKLDMSFVHGITTDRRDRAIVESISLLAKALELDVIGEGVETVEIAEKLIELGCQRGQGYLIARPMSADDLAPIIASGGVDGYLLHTSSLVS